MKGDKTNPTRIIDLEQVNKREGTQINFEEASGLFENLFDGAQALKMASVPPEEKKSSSKDATHTVETALIEDEKSDQQSPPEAFEMSFNQKAPKELDLAPSNSNEASKVQRTEPFQEDALKSAPLEMDDSQKDAPLHLEGLEDQEEKTAIKDIPQELELSVPSTSPLSLEREDADEPPESVDFDPSDFDPNISKIELAQGVNKKEQKIRSGRTEQVTMPELPVPPENFDVLKKDPLEGSSNDLSLENHDDGSSDEATIVKAFDPKDLGLELTQEEEVMAFDLEGRLSEDDPDLPEGMDEDKTLVRTSLSLSDIEESLSRNRASEDEELTTVRSLNNESQTIQISQIKNPSNPSAQSVQLDQSLPQDYINFHQGELHKLKALIENLRADRERLMQKNADLEGLILKERQGALTYQAEFDDGRVELDLLRQRVQEDTRIYESNLKMANEKKRFYQEKCQSLQRELKSLAQRVHIDIGQIRRNERELQAKLELLKVDSLTQIKNRDEKILELKRQIDTLEFHMESVSLKEQRMREEHALVERRMKKALHSLRSSLETLEESEDGDHPEAILEQLSRQRSGA